MSNFQNSYSSEIVLLKDYNNGIVSDIAQESVESRIQMFEKVSSANRSSAYATAMKGVFENNVYSQLFFSKENIQIIQNALRAAIYKKSGYVIPPQNADALGIIMRSTFLQYAQFYEDKAAITREIERLNQFVLDYVIAEVYSSLKAYLHYIKEQSSLPVPIGQPIQVDRDFKQIERNSFL